MDKTRVNRFRALLVGLVLVPAAALAQGADSLALTIEQALTGIEFRVGLRPQQAVRDLEEQRRQLELLERQAPDHPALPDLKERLSRVEEQVATGLADAVSDGEGTGTGTGAAQIPTAPEAFNSGIDEVRSLQDQAETELLRGRSEAAATYLEQAGSQMADLESEHGEKIPAGHVPLIVAKEKQATLEEQLGQKAPATGAEPATSQ